MEFKTKFVSCYASEKDDIIYIEPMYGVYEVIKYVGRSFNNPVSSSIELVNLLNNKKPLTEHQKEYIKKLKENNLVLTRNINNMLDYLKLMSGETRVKKEEFNISDCFDIIKNSVIKKENVKVNYEIKDYILYSDKEKIISICKHVIDHCILSMYSGNIKVKTMLKSGNIEIYFLDSSRKIHQKHINTIFKGFISNEYYLHTSNLNLPIAKLLSKLIGGNLELQSTTDLGNIYKFVINIEDSSSD
jgi:K+-sensing histidine kinase KdpD